MSKYTTTIKNLLDNNFDFQLTSYPIFDENYRETLNNNILYHYYENEIGFETAGLFRFYLKQKLNEIMPYYNELYKNQLNLLNVDSLNNVDLTETFKRENTQKGKNETSTNTESNSDSFNNGENNNKNVFLDTPQGGLYKGNIDDTNYATNVTFDKANTTNRITDNSNSKGNSETILTSDGSENYIKRIVGNNGGKYKIDMLLQIKDNLMNIDLMIINDLNELFMQIF